MITVRGKVENGKIRALEPVDDAFEGMDVTIMIEGEPNSENGKTSRTEKRMHWQQLMETIRKNQIDTDITDMAHQHDHYLYGTPKRED